MVTVAQCELNGSTANPDGSLTNIGHLLENIELILTLLFTAELVFNMYSHWFLLFFKNGYNFIDLISISLSIVALFPQVLNVNFSVLRLVRACRVVRIFGRFKSLQAIIAALGASLVPVLNAFVILLLLMAICELGLFPPVPARQQLMAVVADAIVGVTYFADEAPSAMGIFGRAFVTLFRVTAGDPWPEADLPLLGEDGNMNSGTVSFMMTYIVLVNCIFLQVGRARGLSESAII